MALIKCSECGKEFSDKAAQCPACGCPIEFVGRDELNPNAALSPAKIIEHLTFAKQLEVYKYTLQKTIEKMQYRINSLGHRKSFTPPENKSSEAWGSFWIIFFVSMIPLLLIAISMAPGNFVENLIATVTGLFLFSNELLRNFGIAIGAALVIAFIGVMLIAFSKKGTYKSELKKYDSAVNNDNMRVSKEIAQKRELQIQQGALNDEIHKIDTLLERLYDLNILHANYRNMVAVIRLLEYFDSGICVSLTGPTGAYSVFENEMLHERIITKLDIVISRLEDIRNAQYMLYEAVKESNYYAERMYRTANELLSSNKRIADNVEIAAYNSKIAATSSTVSAYIDVFSM